MTHVGNKNCCANCYQNDSSHQCICHTAQSLEEKEECKSCYGKGYYTQMYNTIGSEDFGGEGFETGSKIHKIPCKECNRIKSLTCDCKDCVPPTDSKLKDKQKEQLIKVAPAEYSNYNILNKKIKRSIALWIRRRNDTLDLDESLTKIIQNLIQSERKEVIGKHNAYILNEWQLKGLGDERVLFPILEKATEISLSSNKPSNEEKSK